MCGLHEVQYHLYHRNNNFDRGRSRSKMDNFQIIVGGMIDVALGKVQVQEQVPIMTELDASSVGNMIILLRIVQI